jgi:PAS domain S-box-containing protein
VPERGGEAPRGRRRDRAHVGFAVCDPGLSFGAIVGLGAKERAAELGVDFSMVSVFTPHQQAAAIERFTAAGVDALIVEAVESEIVVPAIEKADHAGIPVIVADHPIHSVETVCAVRSDNVKGGELAARYLVDRLHGEGVVAHLQGLPTSDTGLDRSRGFHDVVDRHAGIRIVEAGSEWTSDAGAAAMRELLAREPGVHAVFANNDPLALGAVEAVDEAGRTGDIVVAGYDALPDALLAIGDGRMAATIRQRPHAMGRLALEMAVRVHSGDRVPPVVETGVSLVTAHNVAEASLDTLPLFSRLLRDLTESHEALSEERTLLRTLIDNLPDLIYVKDDASRFMVVNSAGLRHLGAASETEVIGRTDFDFFPAEFAAHYRADEQALVRAGEPLINREEATPDSHGRTHWVSTTKVPIRDTSGRIVGLVGMSRDITARKLAEAEQARLATEQAALRRVATLVAGAASPDAVFAAVAEEAGRLLRADGAFVIRYDADETATVVAAWSAAGERVAGALHQPLSGAHDLSALVREIGLRARADDSSAGLAALDIRSTIEAPVTVDRRLWGVMLVASADEDALDGRSEGRLADFTDLVATAIANAEARDELERSRAESRRTAAEQAALRRIATLVARGVRASEIFDALTRETKGILEADASELLRIESDGGVTVVAADHALALLPGVGRRFMPAPGGAIARVLGTGRPARFERDPVSAGRQDEQVSPVGMTGAVAAPVVVNGRVWGVMSVSWAEPRSMPPYPEGRLVQFTELLATAIANADSRDQLAASRARLVTEADAARRRVVRDLHDGAQQRLIHAAMTLGLAERALELGDGTAQPLIAEAMEHMQRANKELRELSHGILPADLTGGGLRGGVDAIVERLDLDVKVDLPAERLPAEIEVSAYFIVAEALTNTVKHAHAQSAEVSAWVNDRTLQIEIRDDGVGGADSGGHGLIGINDRVTALGGHLSVESPVGGGTLIAATLPIALERPDAARPPAIRNSEHVRQATGGSERDR